MTDPLIQSGGTLEAVTGYTVSNFVVNGGADLEIASGGTAAGTTTIDDGALILNSGAQVTGEIAFGAKGALVARDTSVLSGLLLHQFFLGDEIDLLSVPFGGGGTASVTANASGSLLEIVESGSTVDFQFDTNLSGKSFLLSADGGSGTLITLSAMTISSGSTATVSSGQTREELIVLSGGTLNVQSGGTAADVVLSGGTLDVSAGGTASNASISGGGSEFVSGVDLSGT